MKQLSLFDFIDETNEPVVTPKPVPEPVKPDHAPPEWKRYDWQLQQYYKELPDVRFPDEIVLVTSRCPCKTAFTYSVPFGWLNPDVFWCRFPGGAWMQKEPLPCEHCINQIANFLIKLIQ